MTINWIELRKASKEAVQHANKEIETKAQRLSAKETEDVIEKLMKSAITQEELSRVKEIVQKTTNKNLALLAVIQKCSSLTNEIRDILFRV